MTLVASVIPLVPAWRVDRPFDYLVPEKLEGRISVGSLVRIPFGHRRVRGVVVALGESSGEGLEEVAGVVVEVPIAPPPLLEVLEWMAERYTAPRGRVYARVVPPRVRVKVEEAPQRLAASTPETSVLRGYEGGEALAEALKSGRGGAWCVRAAADEEHGSLIAELVSLAVGTVLVAVPEVRYGSHVLEAVQGFFPHAVRVDSTLAEGERAKGMLSLAMGASIGLGGRATVLAPAREPAAIVVDEEQHPSFKEDRSPRYDARRVALERARRDGSVCVFVSSAPSLEWGWAAHEGEMGWVEPPRERARAARPLVHVARPPPSGLSPELHRAVRDELRAGGQVGLLVPARGYARVLWCAACRRSVRCARCEAGMAFTRGERSIGCPRCGITQPAPSICPSCGASEFRYVGAGSERLEEQLRHMFPRARIRRMDPNVLEAAGEHPDRLVGDADIYVTTWIGTKPVIRPEVRLVGVLNADALIRRPDFRAAERAYQALTAMAEWAGPREGGGRLLIQTEESNHHAVQAVVRGDYRFFLEREAEQRRELGYPPFSELIKVRAGGNAEELLAQVRAVVGATARILGPVPVGDNGSEVGLEILIKTHDAQEVASALRVILPRVPKGSRLRVDADPR
jgi:primosomal protein N'